jgi:hypothetical protein
MVMMIKMMIILRKRGLSFLSSEIMSTSSFEKLCLISCFYHVVLFELAVMFGFAFTFVFGCHVRCRDLLSVEYFQSSCVRTSSVVLEMARKYFR